jgi:hypothetical protein
VAEALTITSSTILVPRPIVDARTPVPASVVLQRLHDEVPPDHFTLGWLMGSLQKRSFGIIMLLLALVALTPGISLGAGMLLMIPAFQMMAGKPAPVFPRRIANRTLPTRHLSAFSGKVDTGFPSENATNKEQLERFPIQPDREAL